MALSEAKSVVDSAKSVIDRIKGNPSTKLEYHGMLLSSVIIADGGKSSDDENIKRSASLLEKLFAYHEPKPTEEQPSESPNERP